MSNAANSDHGNGAETMTIHPEMPTTRTQIVRYTDSDGSTRYQRQEMSGGIVKAISSASESEWDEPATHGERMTV